MSDNVTILKPNPTNWHSSEGTARAFLLEPISLIYVLESVCFFDVFSLYSKQLLSQSISFTKIFFSFLVS